MQKVQMEVDKVRRDLIDKSSMAELLELKSKIQGDLESKVDLKEVQQALNECQNDVCDRLTDFKTAVK